MWDENSALAILFANIRRKKRNTDLVTIAEACKYLSELYGSQQAVAHKVGLSTEMIREFLTTLKLPVQVRRLISERKIDGIDVVREISAIRTPAKQIAATRKLANALSKDVRDIKRLIKKANLSVEDARKKVSKAKPEGLHVFIIDFNNEMYQAIIKHAKCMNMKPPELVQEIVTDWLKRKSRINKK
jgi:DNA-directed RNA polymerase subunit F